MNTNGHEKRKDVLLGFILSDWQFDNRCSQKAEPLTSSHAKFIRSCKFVKISGKKMGNE